VLAGHAAGLPADVVVGDVGARALLAGEGAVEVALPAPRLVGTAGSRFGAGGGRRGPSPLAGASHPPSLGDGSPRSRTLGLEPRGFFGLDATEPAGDEGVKTTVRISGDGTPEQQAELHEAVRASSPSCFNVARPVPVERELVAE
jgi:hypothetical protein